MQIRWNYFWFRILANNLHGIHSPFVYRLLKKGIYANDHHGKFDDFDFLKKNQLELTVKLIDYLRPENLHWVNLDSAFRARLKTYFIEKNNSENTEETTTELKFKNGYLAANFNFLPPPKPDTFWIILRAEKEKLPEIKPRMVLDFFFLKVYLFHPDLSSQYFRLRP